jgi:predicted metal-dependent peptidase
MKTQSIAMKRVLRARAQVIQALPFYGTLLCHLKLVESSIRPTMATDGISLLFNPSFVATLSDSQIRFVLVHETLHCAYGHHVRRGKRDPLMWNKAADYRINADCIAQGLDATIPGILIDPSLASLGASESIYAYLQGQARQDQQQAQQEQEEAPQDQQGEGSGEGGQDQAPQDQGQEEGEEDQAPQGSGEAPEQGQEEGEGQEEAPQDQQGEGSGEAQEQGQDEAPQDQAQGSGEGQEDQAPQDQQGQGSGAQEQEEAPQDQAQGSGAQGSSPGQEQGQEEAQGQEPWEIGQVIDAPQGQEQEIAAQWQERVTAAAMVAAKEYGGRDKLPDAIKRLVAEGKASPEDWRIILRRFVDRSISKDYSWQRGNRRYLASGLYLPSLVSDATSHVIIGLDTSGSIDQHIARVFLAQAQEMLDGGSVDKVTLLHCDNEIRLVESFERGDIIETIPQGGGNTSFAPVMDWATSEAESDVACLVYLTDLLCRDWGQEPPFPVLWACWNPRQWESEIPFGEILPFDTEG